MRENPLGKDFFLLKETDRRRNWLFHLCLWPDEEVIAGSATAILQPWRDKYADQCQHAGDGKAERIWSLDLSKLLFQLTLELSPSGLVTWGEEGSYCLSLCCLGVVRLPVASASLGLGRNSGSQLVTDLLNQNLYLSKSLRWFLATLTFG